MNEEINRWNIIMNASNYGHGTKCAICRTFLFVDCLRCQQGFLDMKCELSLGKCGHLYHKHCILKWRQRSDMCPIDDIIYEEETEYKKFDSTEIYIRILKSDEHNDFKKIIYNKLEWSTENHKFWDDKFREQILTLLLISKYNKTKIQKENKWLSKLICMKIIKHIAKISVHI